MIWTGWNNGKRNPTGAGYGFKVDPVDRDQSFKPEWHSIVVELPMPKGNISVEVNVDKASFWGGCRELISAEIGRWMLDRSYAPWPKGKPPKFFVDALAERAFRINGPM